MATDRDAARLAGALAQVSALAKREFAALWARLDGQDPRDAVSILQENLPHLVRRYGDMAAVVAATWYAEVRATSSAVGSFAADPSDPYPDEAIDKRVRSAATGLFDGRPHQTRAALEYSIDKFVKQPGRDTIVDNGMRDTRWGPRFARVPQGVTTCKFCLMLASRGPVYLTRESAGEFTTFHGECDCAIVLIGDGDPLPEGYDPEALYQQYLDDREAG